MKTPPAIGSLVKVPFHTYPLKVVGRGVGIDPHDGSVFESTILYRENTTANPREDFFSYLSVNPAICEEV